MDPNGQNMTGNKICAWDETKISKPFNWNCLINKQKTSEKK